MASETWAAQSCVFLGRGKRKICQISAITRSEGLGGNCSTGLGPGLKVVEQSHSWTTKVSRRDKEGFVVVNS